MRCERWAKGAHTRLKEQTVVQEQAIASRQRGKVCTHEKLINGLTLFLSLDSRQPKSSRRPMSTARTVGLFRDEITSLASLTQRVEHLNFMK